jgi:hypothetical protein
VARQARFDQFDDFGGDFVVPVAVGPVLSEAVMVVFL